MIEHKLHNLHHEQSTETKGYFFFYVRLLYTKSLVAPRRLRRARQAAIFLLC